MPQYFKVLAAICVALVLVGCAGTSAPSKQEMILGVWSGDIAGQSIVLEYTETEVVVDAFGVAFPDEWVDADSIRLDAMGQVVVSTVEFPNPDQMVQRSPQGVQTLRRVNP